MKYTYLRAVESERPLADALLKGLELLQCLVHEGPQVLEVLASQHDLAKSSTLRLLDTLVATGLVIRDPASKSFQAAVRMVPMQMHFHVERLIRDSLGNLADATGQCAEWWMPTDAGMMLLDRATPTNRQLLVLAKRGFLYPRDRLETVPCLGHVWFRQQAPLLPDARQWDMNGSLSPASDHERESRLELAETGYCWDRIPNSFGVRRIALVLPMEEPIGILALAVPPWPTVDDLPERFGSDLRAFAETITASLPPDLTASHRNSPT